MNWIGLALAAIKTVSALVGWLQSRQLLDAGAAREALAALEVANAAVEKGRKARADTRADLERNPERLRDDDGFKRPD